MRLKMQLDVKTEDIVWLENLCLEAVKKNGIELQHVPENLQTDEVCRIAIADNWRALDYVHNKTEELCRIAYKKNPDAIDLMPIDLQNKFLKDKQAIRIGTSSYEQYATNPYRTGNYLYDDT